MADDPELERELEAMFYSARPRRGFEDWLWQRIEGKRPWHQRLRRRLQPAVRYAPALATILVVALGVTWLAGTFHGGLTSSGSTTSGAAPTFGGQKASSQSFGVLPRLASNGERAATAPQTTYGGADNSAGLGFSGTLPSLPSVLPVYRYEEPTAADRAMSAATLQARTGLAVMVTPSDPAAGVEPQFVVDGPAPAGSPAGAAETASSFLSAHNLTPLFAFQVSVGTSGHQVVYVRQFDGPEGPIRQVRPNAAATGITVDLSGATIAVSGPLDLPLVSATYPLRSAGEALAAANVRQVPGVATLNTAELVYVLVVSGGHGYYEPELLLSGPGGNVLAPVVAQGWLAR
jgi:hypothetical protein